MEHLIALIITTMSLGTALLGVISEILKNRGKRQQKDKVVVQVVYPSSDEKKCCDGEANNTAPGKTASLLPKIPVTRRKEIPSLKKSPATRRVTPLVQHKMVQQKPLEIKTTGNGALHVRMEKKSDPKLEPIVTEPKIQIHENVRIEKKLDPIVVEPNIQVQETAVEETKIQIPVNVPCSPAFNSTTRILRPQSIGGAFRIEDPKKKPAPKLEPTPRGIAKIQLGKAFETNNPN